MKLSAFVSILFLVTSCIEIGPHYLDQEANLVDFMIRAEEGDLYKEIRIYSKELRDNVLIYADSVIFNALNKDGTNVTFPKGEDFRLGIEADSIALIKSGSFEAIAVKKNNSLVKMDFGQITNGVSSRSFEIRLARAGITVE